MWLSLGSRPTGEIHWGNLWIVSVTEALCYWEAHLKERKESLTHPAGTKEPARSFFFFLTIGMLKRIFCPLILSRDTFVTILAPLHIQLESHASYFLLRNHIWIESHRCRFTFSSGGSKDWNSFSDAHKAFSYELGLFLLEHNAISQNSSVAWCCLHVSMPERWICRTTLMGSRWEQLETAQLKSVCAYWKHAYSGSKIQQMKAVICNKNTVLGFQVLFSMSQVRTFYAYETF